MVPLFVAFSFSEKDAVASPTKVATPASDADDAAGDSEKERMGPFKSSVVLVVLKL